MTSAPRLFISYSWTTPEHEQWVINLATELVNSGVDVTLDKWDLREGHDSVAFMERMITDPTISKVILICDRAYVDKADGRSGGVGTETQIISAEVYSKQSQDKFVAVIAETSETGKPYLPTYYKSRIYVDLSEVDRYADNFEKLLRWIYNKPLHQRPEIGTPPSFISESNAASLGTNALAKRVLEAIKNNRGHATGALEEYLFTYSQNFERFRIISDDSELDDQIVKSIDDFTLSRNEIAHILIAITQYSDPNLHIVRIHRFFESLLSYYSHPSGASTWNSLEFDNFRFLVHELFLHFLAILLRSEHIESATFLLAQPYYLPNRAEDNKQSTVSFTYFRQYMRSLERREQRLKSNRLSLRADMLEQRSKNSGVQFRHIMQADFVCFLRADLINEDLYDRWWPETLIYANRHYGSFELFARSISRNYLSRTLQLLGTSTLETLGEVLKKYAIDRNYLPRWQFETFSPKALCGFEQLGAQP